MNGRDHLPESGDPGTALDLILRHAKDRPYALALKDEDGSLSYSELLTQVRAIAAGLASIGVEPGDRVALWLPNSAAFLATTLGCLWLGATFVPLALDDTPFKLAQVAADCDPTVIVTPDRGMQPCDPATAFGDRRWVDSRSLLEGGGRVPKAGREAEREAYLIYTPGTTGSPKGVLTPESAFRMAISSAADLMGLDEEVRTLCVSPFHFDSAYGSAFPTLVAGGSIVIPPRERPLSVEPFYAALLEERITHTGFTPAYLRLLLSSPSSATLSRSALRSVGLAGEECMAIDVARLWELLPGLRVFNRYGPTETTIQVTTYDVLREDVLSGTVPIGWPHRGVTFHVVDEDGRIIRGPNEVGELHIGGNQLMRGYWGDDELTSQVLRDDVVAGTTVFRTGDLVYRDLRGRYMYVGRTDSVVKRNGIRVSLREIARVLRGIDGVSDAVCLPVDKEGHLAIAAFLKARSGITVSQVLEATHQELPTGMMPDEVHLRTSFPLKSSGKIDGHRLAADTELVVWSKTSRDYDPWEGEDAGSGTN